MTDLRALFQASLQPWQSMWDSDLTTFENYHNIMLKFIRLPDTEIASRILCAAILTDTKSCFNCAPIIFLYGPSGSGKSGAAIFANETRGYAEVFGPSDTYAGIRNKFNERKWNDAEQAQLDRTLPSDEKHGAIMCFDNLGIDTLREKPDLYNQVLLKGYNYKTRIVSMSSDKAGKNITFDSFGVKLITSIFDYTTTRDYIELSTRTLKFQCDIVTGANELTVKPDTIDWTGFPDIYQQWWENMNNAVFWAKTKEKIDKIKPPQIMEGRRWDISQPVITSLAIYNEGRMEIGAAIDMMVAYWESCDKKSPTKNNDRELVYEWLYRDPGFASVRIMAIGQYPDICQEDGLWVGLPSIVECKIVQMYLKELSASASLEVDRVTSKYIQSLMGEIGYCRLAEKGKAYWVRGTP